ncbi:MAG: glycosyltransferase [Halobacteriota archaeon]|nr:glycosyltransferase [Halobacteriota archaeon]
MPIDEGRRKVVDRLIKTFSKKEEVMAICNNGGKIPDYFKQVKTNRLLISHKIKKEIDKFIPDLLIYFPTSSATIYSLLRTVILKRYAKDAKVITIAHSEVNFNKIHRILLNLISLSSSQFLILTPSPGLHDRLYKYGFDVILVPFGVDTNKFKPVKNESKLKLRDKYSLDNGSFIVAHVGHLNKRRNLDVFKEIQMIEDVTVLIVASESVEKDQEILKGLKDTGVKLITTYVECIEEIYQLSDCYVFRGGAISTPLSVFEAMACNLPIITNRFGILPVLFENERDFIYCESDECVINAIIQMKRSQKRENNTRSLVLPYSWENFVEGFYSDFDT